jgi:hypothetical protein
MEKGEMPIISIPNGETEVCVEVPDTHYGEILRPLKPQEEIPESALSHCGQMSSTYRYLGGTMKKPEPVKTAVYGKFPVGAKQ